MSPVFIFEGEGPIVLGQPHGGTSIPSEIKEGLNPLGQLLLDTDWHIDALYDGLLPRASVVRANFHRYVIDANRDPSGQSLYPGQSTTDLIPLTTFDGEDIWTDPPTGEDVAERMQFHHAYHQALLTELERIKARHGIAVLFDCHSIRSVIPNLFGGQLLDLNIGDNGGTSCNRSIVDEVVRVCAASEFTHVVNGRFRGGWTTRHYGVPGSGIHAVQLEIAQQSYLETEQVPFDLNQHKTDRLRRVLQRLLAAIEAKAIELSEPGVLNE